MFREAVVMAVRGFGTELASHTVTCDQCCCDFARRISTESPFPSTERRLGRKEWWERGHTWLTHLAWLSPPDIRLSILAFHLACIPARYRALQCATPRARYGGFVQPRTARGLLAAGRSDRGANSDETRASHRQQPVHLAGATRLARAK